VRVGNGGDVVAIEHLERALRLDPIGPERALLTGFMGIAQFQQGRFREAVINLREWVQRSDAYIGHGFLAASYGHLGQIAAANDALLRYQSATPLPIAELGQSFPDLTLRRLLREGDRVCGRAVFV
jgi:lipopolysaccharide biosynthesis regulator YciM